MLADEGPLRVTGRSSMKATTLPSRLTIGALLPEVPVVICDIVPGTSGDAGGRQRKSCVAPGAPSAEFPPRTRSALERKTIEPSSARLGLALPLAVLRSPVGPIGMAAQKGHGVVGPEVVESKKSTPT